MRHESIGWPRERASRHARPSWDEYFLGVAKAVAARADCSRAQYGVVIVKEHRIVSTGYNGGPSGSRQSCLDGDCPRAQSDVAHNTPDYSACIALHAEQNAIAYANRADCEGATIYIWGGRPPCDMCAKLIVAAGIARVKYA